MFDKKRTKVRNMLFFIELYRSHEVLWNMNLPSYRRNDLKMKAYEAIGDETEMSVEDVKRKIKSLRTVYSSEKAKVNKSIESGCDADSIYTPSLFWYNEMAFLDEFLIRRKTVDNSNREETLDLVLDCDASYSPASESHRTRSKKRKHSSLPKSQRDEETVELVLDCNASYSSTSESHRTSSKKRKQSSVPKSERDETLETPITINSNVGVFESFGENVGRQLKEFPEDEGYEVMADLQCYLSKRRAKSIRKNHAAKVSKKATIVEYQQMDLTSRSSTPLSANLTTMSSNIDNYSSAQY